MYKIFLIFPCFLFSQYSQKEIDSLMTKEVYRLRDENKIQEIANLSRKVIQNAKNIKYQKGEIYGYARLGNALCNLKKYKEALVALNQANQLIESTELEDNVIKTSIYLGIGRCYSESKTSFQNALVQFEKALFFAKKIENPSEKKIYLSLIYGNIQSIYFGLENEKKGVEYLWKTLSVKEDAYTLSSLARYHNIYTKNSDSAKFYLDKAQKILQSDFERTALYNQWGRYYEEKGEYDQAIAFYKKAESLAIVLKEPLMLENAINGLKNTYEKKGNQKQTLEYSQKYIALKDSLNLVQSINSDVTIKDIVQKNEKNIHQKFSKSQKIYIAFAILASIFLLIFLIKTKKNQKEKEKAIKIIEEKSKENHELQLKVNESFDEIIQLAKNNNPEFLTRFSEVYPDYYQKLITIEPKLLVTELKLCSMIYLGFSSKDIADYTFVTLKAAQHRKFRLRKKLNIPSDADINVWLNENY